LGIDLHGSEIERKQGFDGLGKRVDEIERARRLEGFVEKGSSD
jgi:hypothetical protein